MKLDREKSHLGFSSGHAFWGSKLLGRDFEAFKELVIRKNGQLSLAESSETFLIIVGEGYVATHTDTMKDAFKRLDPSSYCYIDHVYHIEGSRIDLIPLPQNSLPDQ